MNRISAIPTCWFDDFPHAHQPAVKHQYMLHHVSSLRAEGENASHKRLDRAGIVILCSLLAFVLYGTSAFSDAPASAPVVLPIEVLGPAGYVASAFVDVTNPSGVDRLWLQANSLGFIYSNEVKASVRVNEGAWIPLSDSRVTCEFPEANYGCISSGLGTLRLTVGISGVVSGTNRIDFRFDRTDGFTVGWRVLDFNLLRSNGEKVLPPSAFVEEDRTAWTAPRPSSADIAEGKQLWESASLIDSPLAGSKPILATCADCHEKNGADLKYFSFSNNSIVARSVFHGLSQADGEKIASYIRTLPTPAYGTPWDPPYQPGPGLDSKPVEAWAAGAGLEWVLDEDSDMIPYMYPNGDRESVVATDATLNIRELPIAFQLPDWNKWLPRVHPKDGYGSSFTNSDGYRRFRELVPEALSGYPQSKSLSDVGIDKLFENIWHYTREYGQPLGSLSTLGRLDAKLGFRQWKLVKAWEILHQNNLEGVTRQLYPSDAQGREYGELRGWPGMVQIAFPLAPHRIDGNGAPGPYRDELTNTYFSSAWYQVQLILNPGFRIATEQNVVDWKYHLPHIRNLDRMTGHDQTMRYLSSYAKRLQVSDTPAGADYSYGWEWRTNQPSTVWYEEVGFGTNRGALNRTQFKDAIEPILAAWITKTEEFEPDDWCRALGELCLTPSNYDPSRSSDNGYFLMHNENALQMYRLIPELDKLGVNSSILRRMATWSQRAWPTVDWHTLYAGGASGNDAPTVELTSPLDNAVYGVDVDVVLKAGASDNDGTVAKVDFFVNGSRVSTDTSSPFQYTWRPGTTGTYRITAQATDNVGDSRVSAERTITISESAPRAASQSISLNQGWNLVSTYVQPSDGSMAALFAAIESEILLVKNQTGGQFHPPSGLNTIGNWDPTEAYEIYANSAQTLEIAGSEISASNAIAMTAGWNHLAYVRPNGMPIVNALSEIASQVNIVKDASGRVYYPAYGIDEIGDMIPGQGYKIHLKTNASFSYPASSTKSSSVSNPPLAVESSGLMVVEAPDLADGTVVTVSSTRGVEAGQSVVVGGRAMVFLRGDDTFTSTVREGVSEGDQLKVTVTSEGEDVEGITIASVRNGLDNSMVRDGEIRYSKDSVTLVTIADIQGVVELDQNFPNPFNHSTSIRYSLPESRHVKLDIYNVVGQRVARIVDEQQDAGWHTVEFDASEFASGLYLYRLIADDTVERRQMLLRK